MALNNHPEANHRLEANHRPGSRRGAVFVYSGFRASSTWLWSKFRANADLLCYYEPFNEQLRCLTLENIGQARPDNWRSRHPAGAPYVLEYAGMLGEGAGVPGFPAARDLGERYVGAGGVEGPLDDDVAAYVGRLIEHAHEYGRIPLLSCTRLLGRVCGMKAAFGGYHILLIRNLFHQWNSYAGQARFGNWYFLQTLYETLGLARHDATIAQLVRFFPQATLSNLEAWVAPKNFDRVFCYFIGFHLYFLTMARRSVDLLINVNALAANEPEYRSEIVARIVDEIGIEVNLEDAGERVDFPLHPIADRAACIILINEFAAMIKASCSADAQERSFIDGLVADVWTEQDLFQRQTAGAVEYINRIEEDRQSEMEARLREARQEAAQECAEARGRLAKYEALLATAQADLGSERAAAAQRKQVVETAREENEKQLADAHDERRRISEVLVLIRTELEAERGQSAQYLADLATARGEAESLRAMLADVTAGTQTLQSRLSQLEACLVNVDAANVRLADQVSRAKRSGDSCEKRLAEEQVGNARLRTALENVLDDPGAHHRLRTVLDLLRSRRLAWALLPEPLWRRKLEQSLAAMPGFEHEFESTEGGGSAERLTQALWSALLGKP